MGMDVKVGQWWVAKEGGAAGFVTDIKPNGQITLQCQGSQTFLDRLKLAESYTPVAEPPALLGSVWTSLRDDNDEAVIVATRNGGLAVTVENSQGRSGMSTEGLRALYKWKAFSR